MIIVDDEKRFEMHRQGMSDNEMAEALGLIKNSVYLWRNKHNLPPNRGRAVKVQGDTVVHFIKLLHVLDDYQSVKLEHISKAMDMYRGGGLCDLY